MTHRDETRQLESAHAAHAASPGSDDVAGHELFRNLVERSPVLGTRAPGALVIGDLLGLADDGCTALVVHPESDTSVALRARSVVELQDVHVGRQVLLAFLQGDPSSPVVVGVLTGQPVVPSGDLAGAVALEADGQRVVVSAQHELVLRCGKSRLVLRSDGRIELRGETVTTHATRANRIRGGSVELN
jgi:Domain of unknown function (DUF6484)